jgi:hypothetical protein
MRWGLGLAGDWPVTDCMFAVVVSLPVDSYLLAHSYITPLMYPNGNESQDLSMPWISGLSWWWAGTVRGTWHQLCSLTLT